METSLHINSDRTFEVTCGNTILWFSLWRRSATIYVKNRFIDHANYVINIQMVHSKLKPGGWSNKFRKYCVSEETEIVLNLIIKLLKHRYKKMQWHQISWNWSVFFDPIFFKLNTISKFLRPLNESFTFSETQVQTNFEKK